MQKNIKTDIKYIEKINKNLKLGEEIKMKPKKQKRKNDGNINLLYFDKNESKIINKKKIIGCLIIAIIILILVVLYIIYAKNETFRKYLDENILNKEIEENHLKSIKIIDYEKSNIFAFSKYIGILNNNKLTTFNESGKKESENRIEISNPISSNNGRYLMIAEKKGTKVYLMEENNIKWEKDLEGQITRVSVNSNGYSSIIVSGTAYKSVIIAFDNAGNELFKRYLSSTIAVDTVISEDNKYLSMAEVNTTGTLIESSIEVISIENAKKEPEKAVVYKYKEPSNELILDIKYQNKTKLVCEYNKSIHIIKDNKDTKIMELDDEKEKTTFVSINLDNNIVKNVEETAGIFNTRTFVKIINSINKKESIYKFEGAIKELYCNNNKIALNLGTEIHFIDTNGWLIKKYTSSKEVRKIVLTDELAGIVYRDKIEIIKF